MKLEGQVKKLREQAKHQEKKKSQGHSGIIRQQQTRQTIQLEEINFKK